MKRAPIVVTATVAGLAATLGFHARTPQTSATGIAAATATATASPSTTAAPSSPPSSKTVSGDAVPTRYGDVQLKVTISGGKLKNVEAVQLPANDPKSQAISSHAEPLLRQSALTKQSAAIDAVSGATFTSDGYQTALQSALDEAGSPSSASISA